MCRSVSVHGIWCENVSDIETAVAPYAPHFFTPNVRPDDCLCNLDIDSMADALDLVPCNEEGGDPMEIIFLPLREVTGKFFRIGT